MRIGIAKLRHTIYHFRKNFHITQVLLTDILQFLQYEISPKPHTLFQTVVDGSQTAYVFIGINI